ncbi:MAG TPA: MFS transporter [Clostridiales bacterium UBA8960]|nr:MFS transporter [Clostridiales bacterium UBA8960]
MRGIFMKETLWTKNFTLIMLGTVISAIGGVGLSLALSVTVYDNTQSTWLTGLYSALTIIPSILLPVLISPIVDRYSRKNIIVTLDLVLGFVFLLFAWLTKTGYFNFYFYVLMGLIMNINGVIYGLAYDSLFPNLIPKGMFQKGYAIGNLIYPLTNVVVLPVATVIFHHFGVAFMFMLEGILLIVASTFERRIEIVETTNDKIVFDVKSHFEDIRDGFRYLKHERAIWNVYLFFVIMMFADGIHILIYPFFEKSAILSVVGYSMLLSFQSAGYMFGGFLHYYVKIPTHLRFAISVFVYFTFAFLDALFFFMPFVIMLLTKFVLGFIGMNSANIRVTSINNKIEDHMRGRLNAVFQTMVSCSILLGKLVAGWLGELFPYSTVAILYGMIIVVGIFVYILKNTQVVRVLYNQEV